MSHHRDSACGGIISLRPGLRGVLAPRGRGSNRYTSHHERLTLRRIPVVTLRRISRLRWFQTLSPLLIVLGCGAAAARPAYQVFVSNEKSEDVTVIDGGNFTVVATIPVGKRPRGIQGSPDGKTVYVALSGTPAKPPAQMDAAGNPVFSNHNGGTKDGDDGDHVSADKAADGIGVIDVARRKLTGKLNAGSDPEEFALSKDGSRIYISNEDVKTASVMNVATSKVENTILVGQEPEGVATSLDGRHFYVTCEAGGEIYVIDTASYQAIARFKVGGRPRSVDFLPGGAIGFIPSEVTGELNVIDAVNYKVLKAVQLPPGSRPMRVRVAPDGKKLYVSNGRAGTISVLDAHTYEVLDSIKAGARPWGIALSPDGKLLFAANGPSNDVSVVDLATDKELARVKAGSSPWGIAIVSGPR